MSESEPADHHERDPEGDAQKAPPARGRGGGEELEPGPRYADDAGQDRDPVDSCCVDLEDEQCEDEPEEADRHEEPPDLGRLVAAADSPDGPRAHVSAGSLGATGSKPWSSSSPGRTTP